MATIIQFPGSKATRRKRNVEQTSDLRVLLDRATAGDLAATDWLMGELNLMGGFRWQRRREWRNGRYVTR